MEYIEKIVGESNKTIEEYTVLLKKLHRNRDFLAYFFVRKSVQKKFKEVNNLMSQLKDWKVEFDQETKKTIKKAGTITGVKLWLNSYQEYLGKVFDHISILEELQELYKKGFFEKLRNGQIMVDKLEKLDRAGQKCQEYARRYNEKIKTLHQ
ncbi:MAG: hypothetical protein GY705_06825 [Bacteroidetes bacterium]|nr:hypothetical protein [Bacteroidota bacterium]